MKRLYDEHDELNDDGEAFNDEIRKLITPVVCSMSKRGYSIIDIEHVAYRAVRWACILATDDCVDDSDDCNS